MKPYAPYLTLGLSAAFTIAGVLLEGTEQNPWNLFMAYFFPIAIAESLALRPSLGGYWLFAVVSGLAIYGAVWTLGAQHALSLGASLVYIGLVGAVLSSAMMPLRAHRTPGGPGA